MDRVFRRHKTGEVNILKSRKKFLADKDGPQRLKHLRILIVQLDQAELHQFFHENYSAIFYTFSDSFFAAEYELRQKANVGNLKELYSLLPIFEKILLFLPEYIHQRWQYNCILEILEVLLYERNALSTRKEGIRLFLIWYQILGANATTKCHQIFTNLVPEFGATIQEFQRRETLRVSNNRAQAITDSNRSDQSKQTFGIQPPESAVLVPSALFEATEEDRDVEFQLLRHFLKMLVTEVAKVTWSKNVNERHLLQFWFLFEQLKRTYLPLIFPCLSPTYSIYESSRPKGFASHAEMTKLLRDYPIPESRLSIYQEYFVLWLTKYINTTASLHGRDSLNTFDDRMGSTAVSTAQPGSSAGSVSGPKSPIENSQNERTDSVIPTNSDAQQFMFDSTDSAIRSDTKPEMMDGYRGSLSFQSGQRSAGGSYSTSHGPTDPGIHRPSTVSLQNYPRESSHVSPSEVSMVCAVLYGCRQNINLLHDILHHAFLLPMSCYNALFAVVDVYHSWLKDKPNRPVFLQEIDSSNGWAVQRNQNDLVAGLYSPVDDKGHEGDDEAEYLKDPVVGDRVSSFGLRGLTDENRSHTLCSDSSSSSPTNRTVNVGSNQNEPNQTEELRGCLQSTFQVMFENMSRIFLLKCSTAVNTSIRNEQGKLVHCKVDYVRKQIELCRNILLFFRNATINIELSTETWKTLLSTLLDILRATMVGRLPSDDLLDCWLSNEKLIRTVFQTLNVALLRASLVVPISNEPWDQCLAVYSQLTHWPALITEWRAAMEILTSTMARLVYGVDLASLPDEKKSRHGKRNPGQSSIVRARPKSFTDAAVNYLPTAPTILPSTGTLSQSSVHVTSVETSVDGTQKNSLLNSENSRGRLSVSSNDRTRTPNLSKGASVPATTADWSDVTANESDNFEFARVTSDAAEEEDSVSLDIDGEDEIHTDTLLHNRSQSRTILQHSTGGTPRPEHRRTPVPSTEPNFFSLRRAASDLNEVRTAHDTTFDVTNSFNKPSSKVVNGITRASVSPDNLSVLSIGSVVVDRRSRKISVSHSYDSPLQKENGMFPSSPSPPGITAAVGVDDDSSSNLSRNECPTSSRTSAEEASDRIAHTSPSRLLGASPRSNLEDRQYTNVHESAIVPDSIHPTSQCLRRGDTLTADSPQVVVDPMEKPHTAHVLSLDTPRCVLAGGSARGWTLESVVVCWRRFLGILGRVNAIDSKVNLERVFNCFADLINVLLKIREHQLLSPVSDSCVQPIPDYVVPVEFILPSVFEALQLPSHPEPVKLSAIKILSDAVIRPMDGKVNDEVISQFYLLLHRFLTGMEQSYIREIIRSCGPRFFASGLPGAQLLLLDFLRGAALVLGDESGVKEIPRTQALLMYTSLLCYPYHFGSFESLETSSSANLNLITCNDLKAKLLNALIQTAQSDPNAEVRCLALTALAMHCVIELVHLQSENSANRSALFDTPKNIYVLDALFVLLGTMRFPDHTVALVAVEMVLMLAEYCDLFLKFLPRLPPLIIRSIAWTLRLLWSSVSNKIPAVDKRLLVSLIACLVEWVLRLPPTLVRISTLESARDSDPSNASDSILSLVMSTLYVVVCYAPLNSHRKSNLEESSIPLDSNAFVLFPDPLSDFTSHLQTHVDLQLFSTPKAQLDSSSLAMKSFLMGDFGHPWSALQVSGDETYSGAQSVRLAARVAMCQVLNYQDHFPMDSQGALLNTCIQEHHDLATESPTRDTNGRPAHEKELTAEILESSSAQIFVINSSVLVSLLSLPVTHPMCVRSKSGSAKSANDVDAPTESTVSANVPTNVFLLKPLAQGATSSAQCNLHQRSAVSDCNYSRVIVRDFSGKYSWDLSCLYGQWDGSAAGTLSQSRNCSELREESRPSGQQGRSAPPCPPPRLNPNPPPLSKTAIGSDVSVPGVHETSPTLVIQTERSDGQNRNGSYANNTISQSTYPHSFLIQNSHPPDVLHSLLREITSTSPECSISWAPKPPGESDRTDPDSCVNTPCFNMESLAGDQITAQCHLDSDALESQSRRAVSPASDMESKSCTPSVSSTTSVFDPFSKWAVHSGQFAAVRHLFNQLGFLSWERRRTVELIQKSAGLVRDLKHLDKLGARETHKIAVFYVGAGQEDKQSILSNQTASLEFENFVAGLGWEVDLHTHRGFRGGLERSGRAGDSTPYYASANVEVIFHVSTRMPSSTQEDLKYKHLGNDEVMIIWTENARAFSRSMLRTQFGDVLIIISPLPTGLFRVEVRRESDVGFFGPIVQCALLDSSVLPGLVRTTAINASRAIRLMKPGYRAHYEERACSLRQLITRHTSQTCFETFTESLFLPNASNDSILSPTPGLQPTDPFDTAVTRPQDFPIEPAPLSLPPATVAATSITTVSSRAGPVAKDTSHSWSQHRLSTVATRSSHSVARSGDRIPSIVAQPTLQVHVNEIGMDSIHPRVPHHSNRRSRSRKHHSSVDRAYGSRSQVDRSPIATAPIRHSVVLQPTIIDPPSVHQPHHFKHLLSPKSHHHL